MTFWSQFLTTLATPLCATGTSGTLFPTLITLFDHFDNPPAYERDPWYTSLTLWSDSLSTLAAPFVHDQDPRYTFLTIWSHLLSTLAAPLCATGTRGTLFKHYAHPFRHFGSPPACDRDPWYTFLTPWSHFLTTLAAPPVRPEPGVHFFATLVALFDHFGSSHGTTRTRGALF